MNGSPLSPGSALDAALSDLSPGIAHFAGSPAYETARHGWGVITEPAVVLRPRDTAEVAEAVRAAAASGLPLWVKSGGHSHQLGAGVLLDLAALRTVEVLADGWVRLGTGSTWRQVMQQLTPHGLAVSSGDTGCVGVGGIVTGGGFGWLVRTVGLTVDLIRSATVVLADGTVHEVSAGHRPDLLRAVRGSGGNIGVVTEVVLRAHPVGRFAAGRITLAGHAVEPALRAWREVIRTAPETFNSSFTIGFDLGPAVPVVSVALAGAEDELRALLAPVLALPELTDVQLSTVDYPGLFGPDPEGYPPVRVVGSNGFADLTDDLIAAVADYHGGGGEAAPRWLLLRALGGAYARSGPEQTVLGHRAAELIVLPSVMLPADADEAAVVAARAAAQAVLDHTVGVHSNFTGERDPAVVRQLFDPATLQQLRELKAEVDPGWLFRPVHSYPPAGVAADGWS